MPERYVYLILDKPSGRVKGGTYLTREDAEDAADYLRERQHLGIYTIQKTRVLETCKDQSQ